MATYTFRNFDALNSLSGDMPREYIGRGESELEALRDAIKRLNPWRQTIPGYSTRQIRPQDCEITIRDMRQDETGKHYRGGELVAYEVRYDFRRYISLMETGSIADMSVTHQLSTGREI